MQTTDLSSFDNRWYKPGAGKWKIACWYFTNILFFQNPMNPSSAIKRSLLRMFGSKIGNGVVIKPSVNIKYPWNLEVGPYTWIGEKVWIDNLARVTIGSHVCISQGAMLLCGNHNYKKSSFDLMVGEITLEDGVWIGAKTVVCPGVTCKSHSVLTVGSVASKALEAYGIYSGNPALWVKERKVE
jgi:putative colanic acid biosynthesis acetyltransferase WcaF